MTVSSLWIISISGKMSQQYESETVLYLQKVLLKKGGCLIIRVVFYSGQYGNLNTDSIIQRTIKEP